MKPHPLVEILRKDRRYALEAYEFVRDALTYAQDVMGEGVSAIQGGDTVERHLTGQQLCEASRRLALEQYGMMARLVLNYWGIHSTGDLGEIVYNMIAVEMMKKSPRDQREDFDDVFDFEAAFEQDFEITAPESQSRGEI